MFVEPHARCSFLTDTYYFKTLLTNTKSLRKRSRVEEEVLNQKKYILYDRQGSTALRQYKYLEYGNMYDHKTGY